jgi:hypothetical protein
MKWFFCMVPILVLLNPAELYPSIKCNSRVLPDIPTERDSVCIETCIYNWSGSLIDSSLTITGNDILITYTATGPSVEPHLVVRKNHIGLLPGGAYRLITTGYFLKKGSGTMDTTNRSRDTVSFEVLPAAANPPRVVGYTLFIGYQYVDDFHPRRSYFYWNGDTLTIGMAFYYGLFADKFFTGIRQSSDTIVVDIVDTTFSGATMFNGYVAVTSLAPVPQSTHQVMIRMSNWSPYSNYFDPNFHQFIADPHYRGIGLSFRKPGSPEFVLCPNDTMYMDFWVQSPFLDTLKILGIGPNPHYRPRGTERLFIHDLNHGNALIEDWESYDKNDWSYVLAQENGRIVFDTVCNAAGDHWIRMTYANDNNEPVRGFYYRTLDPEMTSSSNLPYVRVFGSVKEPDSAVSGIIKRSESLGSGLTDPMVSYSGSQIAVRFYVPDTRSINRPGKLKATVTDIQGKLIRVLGCKEINLFGNSFAINWDKRGMRNNPVPKGVYIVRLLSATRSYGSMVVVR